jgi:hypothetical protein
MRAVLVAVCFFMALAVPLGVWAGEPSLDEVLGGFDAPPPAVEEDRSRNDDTSGESVFDLGGELSLKASWSHARHAPDPGEPDYRGLSRLRAGLRLRAEARPVDKWKAVAEARGFYDASYSLNGRGQYPDEVLDEMESEAEAGELYLQGRLSGYADITLGRQVVVWGRAESFRVTDVMNPLDLREPGMVDIEDLRLPVAAARLDLYAGAWSVTAISAHEVRFDKTPPPGSDFFPFVGALPPERKPGGPEHGISINGVFTGWDLSFYAARYYDDRQHIVLAPSGPELRHSRITMAGAAASMARGDWLLYGEAARLRGLEFFAVREKKDRTDLLAGVEYAGFRDATVSLEAVVRRIEEFEEAMEVFPDEAREEESALALRVRKDALRERLHLMLLTLSYGGGGGAIWRLEAGYDWSDALSFETGLVDYVSGDTPRFRDIGDRDRIFLGAEYRF